MATTSEAAEFAEHLPDTYLQCRDMGHSWRPYTAKWKPTGRYFERVLQCIRCDALRKQRLSQYGAVLGGSYDYPEGYVHAGLGRLDGTARDALRLVSVTRVATDDESEES